MENPFYITNLNDPAVDVVEEIKKRGISEYKLWKISKASKNRQTINRWLTGMTAMRVTDLVKIVEALGYDGIVIKFGR